MKTLVLIPFLLLSGLVILACACNPLEAPEDSPSQTDTNSLQIPQARFRSDATTWYVDALAGDDNASGSESSPWQTLTHLMDGTVQAGDTVLLGRGQSFRGPLQPVSGTSTGWTRYATWGSGSRPVILGSEAVSESGDWELDSGNIWRSHKSSQVDVGALHYQGFQVLNAKKWSMAELSSQGDFFFNWSDGRIYLYSSSNPATYYPQLEAALGLHVINWALASYVVFEGLHPQFGGAHGFGGGNTHHLIVRDCEMSWLGGADLDGSSSGKVRYGNGLEFWAGASTSLVENCLAHDIYDTGLTNQNHGNTVTQEHLVYRNNIVYNCGLASFEVWNRPAASVSRHIWFVHNSCWNAGAGWGGDRQYREDKNVFHVALFSHEAQTSGIHIENNIFYSDKVISGLDYQLLYYDTQAGGASQSITVNHNLWYQTASPWFGLGDIPYTAAQVAEYQSASGNDADSVFSEPGYTNPAGGDFSLSAGSPARDAGLALDCRTRDALGQSASGNPDLGALEAF